MIEANAVLLSGLLLLLVWSRTTNAQGGVPISEERALTTTDELALVRATSDGLSHLEYYVGNEEFCQLDLYEREIPEKFCEDITHNVCDEELVLRFRRFRENCTSQEEYCSTKQRTQTFYSESVLCFKSKQIHCPDGNTTSSFNITVLEKEIQEDQSAIEDAIKAAPTNLTCHENRVAVCTEIPVTITITEKKKKCRKRKERRIVEDIKTEKFCVTFENGTWTCKDLQGESENEDPDCITRESVKKVNSEIVNPRLDCVYKKLRPFCHAPECWLDDNTEPICQRVPGIPRPVELSETICEECVEGRLRTEPVLAKKEICREKNETYCVDSVRIETKWRKICTKVKNELASEDGFYKVEIAPGLWITTRFIDILEAFREVQANAEREYRELNGAEDVPSSTPPSTTQDPVLKKFILCANDRRKCKFT